jgi:hypothetical protein
MVTPAGIKYLDPGAEAMDAVNPKELELKPRKVNDGKSSFDARDPDHAMQTLRAHISVNVYPHKGPIPVQHDVTYMAKDAAGNEATVSRTVTIEDLIPPKLTPLSEDDAIEVEGGDRFDDAFAIAQDNLDGDLTWDISLNVARTNNLVRRLECCQERDRTGGGLGTCIPKKTGCESDTKSVETRAPAGTIFKFTYSVKDRGNAAAAKVALREVKIVDTTPPVIKVKKGNVASLANMRWEVERGASWTDEQVKILKEVEASDNIDDHPWITERIQISDCVGLWPDDTPRCVDTLQPAFTKFTIQLNCDDFVGNSAEQVELLIIIVDSAEPTITISDGETPGSPMKLEAMNVLPDAINQVKAADAADTPNGQYAFFSTTATPLRHASRVRALVSEKKSLDCNGNQYFASDKNPVACVQLTECGNTQYESKAPTKTSDRVCTATTECDKSNRLQLQAPTATTDRICCNCRTCGDSADRDKLEQNLLVDLEKCRPDTPDTLSLDESYSLQEDEDPRKNTGVVVGQLLFKDGYESSNTGISLGVSLLVVGVDNTYGKWAWRCCTRECPSSQPFIHFVLDSASYSAVNETVVLPGLLLKPACEIRFEPNEHFNTELDAVGNAFDETKRPTITVRVWDMDRQVKDAESSLDLVGREINLADEAIGERLSVNWPTSMFGDTPVTIPLNVGSVEDEPRVLVSSQGQDVAHVAVFEIGGPPVSIVDRNIDSYVFSPETVVNSIEVVLAIGGSGGKIENEEEIIFSAISSASIEAAPPRRSASEIRYSFRATGFTPDLAQFNELVDSFQYVHRNPSSNNGKIDDREVRFTVNEDENGATYSYVEIRPGEGRPKLDLDPQHPDVNRWVRWKALQPSDSTLLFPTALIADDSDELLEANLIIENAEPNDLLTVDDVTTAFCEGCKEKAVHASARYLSLNGEFRLTAKTTVDEWEKILRSIRYSGGVPRRIHVVLSNNHSDSLPATVIISEFVTPWIDLNGDAPGNDLTERDGISFVQGQRSLVPLFKYNGDRALVIKTDERGGGNLKKATVKIINAADCPDEILGLKTDALRGTGLKEFKGTGSLSITGFADAATYARVLRDVQYFNLKPVPTQGVRRIEVIVTDQKSNEESEAAVIILTVRTTNDPPVMFPRELPPRFPVPQDSLPDTNEGISTIELVDAETAPVVESTERLQFKLCNPGCTFAQAAATCLSAGRELCSRTSVEELWSQGTTPGEPRFGVHPGNNNNELYWTKDTEKEDPYSDSSLRQNSLPDVDIGEDDATTSESAYLVNVYPQALKPRFTLARQVDSAFATSLRFGAVCCVPEESKSAEAIFNVDGVQGTVGFFQGSAGAATRVSLSFKGLSQRAGAFSIYELPVPASKVESGKGFAGFEGSCAEIGEIYKDTKPPSVLLSGAEDYYGSFLDDTINLFGSQSVIGRSFGIFKSSQLWICATIVETGGPITRLTAALQNPDPTGSPVSGLVTFDQLEGSDQASVHVSGVSNLYAEQYDWTIAPPGDGPCPPSRSTGVFDPSGQALAGGRAMGDLTRKAGGMKLKDSVYSVPGLSLTGIRGIFGAKLVLRNSFEGPPIACAVIGVAPPSKLVTTVLAARGVEGFLTLAQDGENEDLTIGMRMDVLQRGTPTSQDFEDTAIADFKITIHDFPVPPQHLLDPKTIGLDSADPGDWKLRCSDEQVGAQLAELEVDQTERIPIFSGRSVRMAVKSNSAPVSLYGERSVEGRALVIESKSGVRRCVSLGHAGGNVVTAVAKFKGKKSDGYSGTITFRQGLQRGVGTSALVEIENDNESRPKGWGISAGQEPCGCVRSEGQDCSILETPLRIDAVNGQIGQRVIDMTKKKQFFCRSSGNRFARP